MNCDQEVINVGFTGPRLKLAAKTPVASPGILVLAIGSNVSVMYMPGLAGTDI
jgi:hypothetical protein